MALQRLCGGKIQFGIHAQGQHLRGDGGQLPQVAVAQAAVGMGRHFDDAGVQALVQKIAQAQYNAGKHPPVHLRRGQQRQQQGGQGNAAFHPGDLEQVEDGPGLDQVDHGRDDDGRQRGLRHMVERGNEPQHHHHHQQDGKEVGVPGLGAGQQIDGRARERGAGGKAAEQAGADLGQALGDQVLVLVPAGACLLVLDLGAGCGFQEADQRDHQHRQDQRAEFLPTEHAGPCEVRQAAGQMAHHIATGIGIPRGPADDAGEGDDDNRRRKGRAPALGQHQQRNAAHAVGNGMSVKVLERGRVPDGTPGAAQAQHRWQLGSQDQQRGRLGEAGQHRGGDQVEQPAGTHQPQYGLHQTGQNGHPGCQQHPVGGPGLGQPRQRSTDQQRTQGGGADAQPGRAAEQHRDQGRDNGGINAGDQRHASQRSVGHALGKQHQPDRQTGPELPLQQCGGGPGPGQKREVTGERGQHGPIVRGFTPKR